MYLGMQDQFYTFSMFDAQAWYARDYILGRIKLPCEAEMQKETARWVARGRRAEEPDRADRFPDRLHEGHCKDIDYPKFDLDMAAELFKEWEHHKEELILGYRDNAYASPCTGTMAPVHHTPWLKAMDNSMRVFWRAR